MKSKQRRIWNPSKEGFWNPCKEYFWNPKKDAKMQAKKDFEIHAMKTFEIQRRMLKSMQRRIWNPSKEGFWNPCKEDFWNLHLVPPSGAKFNLFNLRRLEQSWDKRFSTRHEKNGWRCHAAFMIFAIDWYEEPFNFSIYQNLWYVKEN